MRAASAPVVRLGVAGGEKQTWGFRLAPRQWPLLFRAVRETPDDVALGARVFFAVGGHDEGPAYRRMMRDESGRALVEQRRAYPSLLRDRDALRELPRGTLGREYVRQLDERGIDPQELSELTERSYVGITFSHDHAYVRDRVRELHDLIHTLTNCGVDLVGEAGVAGFTLGQTGNKGWAMLMLLNTVTGLIAFRVDSAVMGVKAFLRGRRARFLPAVDDWERLLRLPIEAARAELGVEAFSGYRPLHLEDVFANAPGATG